MPTTVKAFGAHGIRQPLVPLTIERRDVGPHDVRLDNTAYARILASDVRYRFVVDGATLAEPEEKP
ncbi:hypothetical protein ACFZDK_47935 [Streptomyces sp. NPDC007901]|uniref:hypothetical protein n=1 Tax=Streptomyces sp. NPDC007901 TaxID=3364785 RepID=UPI0036F16632